MGSAPEPVLIGRDGPVAMVTLNRPEAMNALSHGLRAALAAAFATLAADTAVRAIVLTGAGERAFCAGLDLKELSEDVGAIADPRPETTLLERIERCPKPVIAAVNGVAVTGGLELALACDVIVASTAARFADTHASMGVVPGGGLSQKLSRLIGVYRARELSFSGRFLDAGTAERWGLTNHVVEPDALLPFATGLAHDMAAADPAMLATLKALMNEGFAATLAEGLALEADRATSANARLTAGRIRERRDETLRRGRAR